MAFKLTHWTAVVAVLCVVTVFVYRPSDDADADPPPAVPREFDPDGPRGSELRLAREIRELKTQLELASRRDSIIQKLTETGATNGPQLFVDPSAESLAEPLRASLRSEWRRLGEPAEVPIALHVRMVLRSDQGPLEPVPPTSIHVTTLLPDEDHNACIRFVTIPRHHGIRWTVGTRNFESIARVWGIDLGPCAAYAKFGVPGPTVSSWLANTNHRFTTDFQSENEDRRYRNRVQRANIRDYSPRALACAANKQQHCAALLSGDRTNLFASTPLNVQTQWIGQNGRFSRPGTRLPVYGWDFGGLEAYLLSALFRETDVAKFHQFWRSAEPFETAFFALVNQQPGEWMANWAASQIGPVRAGPRPGVEHLGIVFGIAVLGLLAAVGVNRRAGWWS